MTRFDDILTKWVRDHRDELQWPKKFRKSRFARTSREMAQEMGLDINDRDQYLGMMGAIQTMRDKVRIAFMLEVGMNPLPHLGHEAPRMWRDFRKKALKMGLAYLTPDGGSFVADDGTKPKKDNWGYPENFGSAEQSLSKRIVKHMRSVAFTVRQGAQFDSNALPGGSSVQEALPDIRNVGNRHLGDNWHGGRLGLPAGKKK